MNKDFKVNIKVRNNRIIKAIEESGGQLGQKWCDAHGLRYTSVNDLINLKASPLAANKIDLSTTAYRLCEILNKSPNELWSDEQINPLQINNVAIELSAPELKQIVAHSETEPDKLLALSEMKEKMADAINTLTNREQYIIKRRFFDNMTLSEIAEEQGVISERIRQIEAKALRKLRHPRISNDMEDYLGELQ